MALVDLLAALAVLQFVAFGFAVGRARQRYGVPAPATSGNEMFERYFRVQMNTLEQLVMVLPGLWLFGYYVSAPVAAALGALYLIGRMVYFFAYVKDPKTRSLGFALSALPAMVLLGGAIVGAARAVLIHP